MTCAARDRPKRPRQHTGRFEETSHPSDSESKCTEGRYPPAEVPRAFPERDPAKKKTGEF